MERSSGALALLVAACTLALGACGKQVEPRPDAAPDTTVGTTAAGTNPQPLPGQGLNGGLDAEKKANAGTAAMGGSPALDGSTNSTPGNAVGQR
ncbi:hypothetical protein GCM10028796_55710 [Ramlibacter monticola]|uniref:Lipoprotein n=1 Tax=Ramlibacter monticola TaxID=1926872 RepID=A0A936Z526_9BURK|nr:hypothetical protein [Ramlibacter monticola]MBL0395184.1 hypothetical protein [Ramlibacter monticola]